MEIKEYDLAIGERLRLERERLNMTAVEVYSVIKVNRKTYRSYESGVTGVPTAVISFLRGMGFDSHYIVTGEHTVVKSLTLDDDNYLTLDDGNYKMVVIGVVANGSNVISESIFKVYDGKIASTIVGDDDYNAVDSLAYLKYFIITSVQHIYEQRRQHQRAFNEYSQKIMINTFNKMLEDILLASTVEGLCHENMGGIKVVIERYTAISASKDLHKLFW